MKADHPQMMDAYESFNAACVAAGPLDARTVALVKLCISMGAGMEGAAHSHTRKALEAGWTPDELLHAAFMCAPTIGFPNMMRARGWVLDVTEKNS
ncbi:MAG: carboxymuconolactone decarboxylase family protein [Planctomycetota bacterium]|nr:MAG: carboxymuconolactone decarboxylase family protein [Planctomycetota bacterium]